MGWVHTEASLSGFKILYIVCNFKDTLASDIFAKTVLVSRSPDFTDSAETRELMLTILLGHSGELGKTRSFTGNKYLKTPVFLNPFLL